MKEEKKAAPHRHLVPALIARQLLKDFEEILAHYKSQQQVELAEHLMGQLDLILEHSKNPALKKYLKRIEKRDDELLKKYGKLLKPFTQKQFYKYFQFDLLVGEKGGYTAKEFNSLKPEEQQLTEKEIEQFVFTSHNLLTSVKQKILLGSDGSEIPQGEELSEIEGEEQDKDATRSRQLLSIYFLLKAGFGIEHRQSNFVSDSAKFAHLLTGTKFTSLTNSEVYKKYREIPNHKKGAALILDLKYIRTFFKALEIAKAVELIDKEIERAISELPRAERKKFQKEDE